MLLSVIKVPLLIERLIRNSSVQTEQVTPYLLKAEHMYLYDVHCSKTQICVRMSTYWTDVPFLPILTSTTFRSDRFKQWEEVQPHVYKSAATNWFTSYWKEQINIHERAVQTLS